MVRVIKNRNIPFGKNFIAITLGEFIFTKIPLGKSDLNHELIHVRQQRELLYLPFFIWYAAEWLVLLLRYRNALKAYRNIRFEREAYAHQDDLTYLSKRRPYCYLIKK